MTKFKDLSEEDKLIREYRDMRWVRIMGYGMLAILGAWMIISPAKPEHASIEKVTVSLVKDLWGIPMGVIMLTIGFIGLAYFVKGLWNISEYSWIRFSNGHYLYFKKRRVYGLASIYQGNNLIVFHPQNDSVVEFKDYKTSPLNKFLKGKKTEGLNNNSAYWTAGEDGYTFIYKGESLPDNTSEYRGDDLYVKSAAKHVTFRLKDYKNLKDNTLREAQLV